MSNNQLVFSKPGDLTRYLEQGKSAIQAALPKHLNPDRMLRLAVTAFSTNPQLRQCTGQSILASIILASQLGLEPGVAGQGYLIPYAKTCTFVPGWQGVVSLLNNTGRATAWTNIVFEGDQFEFELGAHPRLKHIPGDNYGSDDLELMKWVYACGKVNGSEQPVIECWPMSRVWKHRDKNNKVGRLHYSFKHPEMYARKVVLLQVLKYMPKSIELANAIVASDAVESNRIPTVGEGGIIDVEDGDIETNGPDMTAGTQANTRQRRTNLLDKETENKKEPEEQKKAEIKPADQLRQLARSHRRSEAAVLAWFKNNGVDKSTLDFVPEEQIKKVIEQWPDLHQDIEEDIQ